MNRLFCILAAFSSLALVLLPGCPSQVKRAKRPTFPVGKNYKSWKQVTKRKAFSSGHKAFQRIYINDTAYQVSKGDFKPPYPKGSAFVVIRYGKENNPQPFAWVMTKMGAKYDPARNNWRYTLVRLSNWTYSSANEFGRLA